jgi:hypothetical protein
MIRTARRNEIENGLARTDWSLIDRATLFDASVSRDDARNVFEHLHRGGSETIRRNHLPSALTSMSLSARATANIASCNASVSS